jgi:hypothetical protein
MKNLALICFAAVCSGQVLTSSISGKVIDSTGSGLQGTKIELQPGNLMFVTDVTGEFRFSELNANTYRLLLTHGGFQRTIFERIVLAAGEDKLLKPIQIALARNLTCGSAPEIQSLIAISSSTGELSGVVKDEFEKPVQGARIKIECASCTAAESSSSGRFVVREVPPGTYSVEIKKRGFKTLINPGFEVIAQRRTEYLIYLENRTSQVRLPRGKVRCE